MPKYLFACFACSVLAMAASGCCCMDRTYCPTGCESGGGGGGCVGCATVQHANHQLGGCAGCGDVYWGEWASDPPDCCDPCDGCGNFTGSQCCMPNLWSFLSSSLCGSRCGCDSCSGGGGGGYHEAGGCSSCGGGGGGGDEYGPWNGVELNEGTTIIPGHHGEPKKATPIPQSPTKAAPEASEPAQPMTQTHAMHHHRPAPRSSPKSLHMQPTRSKRPPNQHPHSANGQSRPRTL